MYKQYLVIKGSRGQATIQQARGVPNQFKVEHQAHDGDHYTRPCFTSWIAYAMAYDMAHGTGRAGSKNFVEHRYADLGF